MDGRRRGDRVGLVFVAARKPLGQDRGGGGAGSALVATIKCNWPWLHKASTSDAPAQECRYMTVSDVLKKLGCLLIWGNASLLAGLK